MGAISRRATLTLTFTLTLTLFQKAVAKLSVVCTQSMVKVFEGAHHEDVTVVHGNVPQVYGHAVAAAKIGVLQCRLYVCGGWEQRSDRGNAQSDPVQLMVDGNQFLTLHELDISDVVQHEEEYSNLVAPRGRFEDCANRFTNSAPGPSQRVFHSLTAFTTLQEAGRPPRQELWLFGGTLDTYYPEYYFDDVWRLDIDQNPQQWQWDKVEPSGIGPTRRYGHATAQVGTNLLIHGGRALVQHQAQVACRVRARLPQPLDPAPNIDVLLRGSSCLHTSLLLVL